MINLPVLDHLDVSGYGLFPGSSPSSRGLHIDFKPGITLILGANGLGKTTLINILYRLLTGPADIPGLAARSDLGTKRLTPSELRPPARAIFAQRVLDGATGARGRLAVSFGSHAITIERRLDNLTLVSFTIDGKVVPNAGEGPFQDQILRLVGVWSFGDWILLLRYLMFYFEDRRALVWDPTAQRQLLRLLFLPPSTAKKWTEDEREILELDSRMRNLSAALYREERELAENEVKSDSGIDVRQQLSNFRQ
jgi:hypothetical protein